MYKRGKEPMINSQANSIMFIARLQTFYRLFMDARTAGRRLVVVVVGSGVQQV